MIDLEPGEHIILEVRKHLLAFFFEIAGVAFAALIPLILYQVTDAFFIEYAPKEFGMLFGFAYSIWLIFLWISVFISWTNYYLDTWIITNKRVVDFEVRGLFSRDIVSVKMNHIEDVKINISGLLNTMLDIGELHIQTAAENREFTIKNAHQPEKAKEAIMRAMGKLSETPKGI